MNQRSAKERLLWAQFDALEMGTGWDDLDITRPQIMVESVYGDSHPGSFHLNQVTEQAVYGVYERGGKPAKYYATDICDGCAQGHDGMNFVLASREAIANMVEVRSALGRHDPLLQLRQVHPRPPEGSGPDGYPHHFHPRRLHAPRPQPDHFPGGR